MENVSILFMICVLLPNLAFAGRGGRGGRLPPTPIPPSPFNSDGSTPSPSAISPITPVPPLFPSLASPPDSPSAPSVSTPPVGRCSEGAAKVRSFDLDEINSLIFRLEVETFDPIDAWVEYEADVQFSTDDSDASTESIDSEDFPRLRSPSSSGTSHTFYFLRLLQLTRYDFEMYTQDDCAALIGFFITGTVPREISDRNPRRIEGTPTWDLIAQVNKPFWYIFDNNGNIVWWIEREGLSNEGAFLVLKNHNFVVQLDAEERGTDGGLFEFSPTGDFQRTYEAECEVLHHGLDFAMDSNGELDQNRFTSVSKKRHEVTRLDFDQASDTLGHMDIETGEWEEYFDLIDFIDPRTTSTNSGTQYRFVATQFFSCPQDMNGDVIDYLHINSVQEYEPGALVVSARNIHTICAIKDRPKGGWQMQWVLSSNDTLSDFEFPRTEDKFYGQHAVRVLPNGNVLLFDNGKGRPRSEGGEFSRALELELVMPRGEMNGTARAVWEFELSLTDDLTPCMAAHRGEILLLENGNRVVFFPSCDTDPTRGAYYVELDERGNKVSLFREDLQLTDTPFLVDFWLLETIGGEFEIR